MVRVLEQREALGDCPYLCMHEGESRQLFRNRLIPGSQRHCFELTPATHLACRRRRRGSRR